MPKKRARSTAAPDDWSVGLSILEASAIRPASQRNYARTLMKFTQFCHFLGLTWTDTESLDATVITFMTAMFLDGEGVHSGAVLVAALRHLYGKAMSLPRAARALTGWRRLAPPRQRLPLPRAAMFAIAGALMAEGRTQMALAVALAFSCYLRPIELMALRGGHLVPPVASLGLPTWGLVLHDSALGIPGKTGAWDAAVAIDLDSFLWPPLHALKLGRKETEPLWDFSADQLRRSFKEACHRLCLDNITDHLYGLRHGGASDDMLRSRRSLLCIKERGRWASDTSLKRYAKATLLQRETSKVPAEVLTFGQQVEERFVELLAKSVSAKGLPLSVPHVHPPKIRKRRPS